MPWKQSVGAVNVLAGGPDAKWKTFTVNTKKITGVHALWLRFYGDGEDLFTVDWLKFSKKKE